MATPPERDRGGSPAAVASASSPAQATQATQATLETQPQTPASLPGGDPLGSGNSSLAANPRMVRDRRSRNVGWRSRDVLRTAALVIGMYLAIQLLWFAHVLVLTAFLGVLFGLAVTAGVDKLAQWRIPRGVAAAIIVFGSVGLIVGFFAWTAPTLRTQSRELRTKLPEAIDKMEQWIERRRTGLLGAFLEAPSAAKSATTAAAGAAAGAATGQPQAGNAARADSSRAAGGDTGAARQAAAPAAAGAQRGDSAAAPAAGRGTLRERVFGGVSGAQRYLFGFVTSTFAALGGLLLVLFLAIYVAADPDTYHDGMMHLFPHKARRRAGEVLTAMATALRKWLVTQLIAMLAIGAVTTVVLLLLGVPAAFPLGILAGLLEFIPTVGPIISAVPAIAMGFAVSPEKALWVALAYVGIQFLENHILVPILMKEGVDLPPALTIFAQALMALVFGFLGLLVAVPMLAALKVAVTMLYVQDVVGDDVEVLEEDDD